MNTSQEELAKQLGTKGPAIGRYERDEMKPSIEAAAKMAAILDISLDYLVGNSDVELLMSASGSTACHLPSCGSYILAP